MKKFLITQLLNKYNPKLVAVFGVWGRKEARDMVASALGPHTKVFSASANNFFAKMYEELGGMAQILAALVSSKPFPFVCVVDAEANNREYCYLKEVLGLDTAVITASGDVPSFNDLFTGEEKLAKKMLREARDANSVILNLDDDTLSSAASEMKIEAKYFGFDKHADLKVESVNNFIKIKNKSQGGVHIKVEHEGAVVPLTINNVFGKRNIYGALCALLVAVNYDINFVSAAQDLAKYSPQENYLKLQPGIKSTALLVHNNEISAFSAREALETMGDLRVLANMARVVAVMSDVLTHKKGEAEGLHRTLGELASHNADLLFLAGERVIFVQEEAQKHGMPEKNIVRVEAGLDEMKRAAREAQNALKKGDLVLILGSEETEINKALTELKYR